MIIASKFVVNSETADILLMAHHFSASRRKLMSLELIKNHDNDFKLKFDFQIK